MIGRCVTNNTVFSGNVGAGINISIVLYNCFY
jgi:hypothetical protein